MKEDTLKRNPMNIINEIKPLYIAITFKYIKEDIQVRNPMNVSNWYSLHLSVIFKGMKEIAM